MGDPDHYLKLACDVSTAIRDAQDEPTLASALIALLGPRCGAPQCQLSLLGPRGLLEPIARYPSTAPSMGGAAGAERAIIEMTTIVTDADGIAAPVGERGRAQPVSCAVPLVVGDRALGALTFGVVGAEDRFTSGGLAALEAAAELVSGSLAMFRDREALRTSRDQLQALFDASPDMVFVHGGDGYIIDVNEQVIRNYGMTREELRTCPPETLMGPEYTAEVAFERLSVAFETGANDFEWTGRRGDGSLFPCEVRLRRVAGPDCPPDKPAIVAVIRDTTERKRYEEQLVEASRAETLAAVAGGVAHDFNNLLGAILGAASALAPSLASDAERALARDVVEAARNARGLTRQLLALSRGAVSERSVFRLPPVISQAVRHALGRRDAGIRLAVAADLWPVIGDRDQLAGVVYNVLLAAVRAAPPGGEIHVSAHNRHVPAASPEDHTDFVVLEVVHRGAGLTPEARARLFDPFHAMRSSGAGLGLATAYAIVRRHGGLLSIESKDAQGARATVTLPAQPDAVEVPRRSDEVSPGPPPAAAPTTGLSVLLLEDDEILQRVVAAMLRQLGHASEPTSHGDATLTRARELAALGRPCEVAILDLTIDRGRGGADILAELRQLLPNTWVIGTSGYTNVDPASLPFDDFLPKPFALDELREVLRRARRPGV